MLRPGGMIGVSVWLAGRNSSRLTSTSRLSCKRVSRRPSRAFDSETFKMTAEEVEDVLKAGGGTSLEVRTIEREVLWPDAASAALGIFGTPFAPLLDQLPQDRRDAIETDLVRRFAPSTPGGPVGRTTIAVIARATTR